METRPLPRPSGRWILPLALAWAPACAQGTEAAPDLAALVTHGPAVFDFGRVLEGSVLTHDWEFEVRAPLTFASVKTDCGCTLARLERARGAEREAYAFGTPLAAGERLFVRARYDTLGKRGPAARALVLTTLTGDIVPLTLQADVRPWLVLEPEDFAYVRITEGATAERDFRVRSVDGAPFGLTATRKGLPPSVTVELAPEAPDAGGRATAWTGSVRIGAETPRGTHSYPIELVSDVPVPASLSDGKALVFRIQPSWTLQIVGPVALSPQSLEFGLVDARETVAQTVRLECFDPAFTLEEPVARLEPLRPTDPFPLGRTASVHSRPVPGLPAYDIEVTLGGLAPEVTGTFLARLVVETGHPGLARLEATIQGVRAPEGKRAQ